MIPQKTIEELISKHSKLEKELTAGEIDKKQFAEKSKEYSDLNDVIISAKEYEKFWKDGQLNGPATTWVDGFRSKMVTYKGESPRAVSAQDSSRVLHTVSEPTDHNGTGSEAHGQTRRGAEGGIEPEERNASHLPHTVTSAGQGLSRR